MKNAKSLMGLVFILHSLSSSAQKEEGQHLYKSLTTKEYFLCKCIGQGFATDSLLFKDSSSQMLLEYAMKNDNHSYEYMNSVSKLAKRVANSFPVTPFGTRSVFLGCTLYYRSRKLSKELAKIHE